MGGGFLEVRLDVLAARAGVQDCVPPIGLFEGEVEVPDLGLVKEVLRQRRAGHHEEE